MKRAQESCISQAELGQRLVMVMATAGSLQDNSQMVAFGELGPRQEMLHCSRVKQVK